MLSTVSLENVKFGKHYGDVVFCVPWASFRFVFLFFFVAVDSFRNAMKSRLQKEGASVIR